MSTSEAEHITNVLGLHVFRVFKIDTSQKPWGMLEAKESKPSTLYQTIQTTVERYSSHLKKSIRFYTQSEVAP